MVVGGGVFSEVISFICGTGFKIYVELFLIFSVPDPIETHVHFFGLSLLMVPVAMRNAVELST